MPVDLVGWKRAHAERCTQLAAAVLIVYEHGLQFDQEVELFWKKRWSPGKCLFIWSRYYSLAFILANVTVFMTPHPSQPYCHEFFHLQDAGASLQVITTHIILELRLYAMYRGNRFVVCLLVFLTIGEAVAMGSIFSRPSGYGVNNPAVGVFICADGDSPDKSWIVFFYGVILLTECTLLSLSLYKAWTYRKTSMRMQGSILYVLTRDSVYYFAFLFWVYLANFVLWINNISTLNELATGFSFSLSAIFANRLMISLRGAYYHQTDSKSVVTTQLQEPMEMVFLKSSRVGVDSEISTGRHGGVDELMTFNERSGF